MNRQMESTIYCIGFSQGHDAKLLNSLAQAGSNVGNFIYIDSNQPNYQQTMHEAIRDSMDMAIESASSAKLIIKNEALNFTQNLKCKSNMEIKNKVQNSEVNQMTKVDSTNENWNTIRFQTTTVLKKLELENL